MSLNNDTVTDTIPNSRVFDLNLLPAINTDLKICDLVKQNNILLQSKVVVLENDLSISRTETITANNQARKEKRKRIVSGVVRTVLEVGVLVAIIVL